MARPGLTRHRKFLRLAHLLGSRAAALGTLELVWEVGYEAGDSLIGDTISVESAADWRGPHGQLAGWLVECGFLDRDPDGSHRIHDFWAHAPAYVRKRRQRELDRTASAHCLAADQSATSQRLVTDRKTAPLPAPSTQKTKAKTHTGADAPESADADDRLPIAQGLEVWARTCPELPQPRAADAKRKRAWRARCREPGFAWAWPEVCRRIAQSPFCCGEGPRGWRADWDWATRAGTWRRVLEGVYDAHGPGRRTAESTPDVRLGEHRGPVDPEREAAAEADCERLAREREARAKR